MKSLKDFIINQQAVGKSFFVKKDALGVLSITPEQFRYQAYRLSQKGFLRRLALNFYMMVPPEYLNLGTLPPIMFIDHLMRHFNQDYYVGLLSAASFYGATHQKPMSFQVITKNRFRNIVLDRGLIEFHTYKNCSEAIKVVHTVPTGYVQISSREQTMLDLIRFYQASGYLSNVALVIKTLAEEGDQKALAIAIKNEKETPVLQRLGYILKFVGFSNLASIVAQELKKRKLRYVLLRPEFHRTKGKKLDLWMVIVNDTLELE